MMVETEIQNRVLEEVRGYLKRLGVPADVKIGGNVKRGENSLSVRAFVETPNLRRIYVEYAGPTLKGLPTNFNGWANFFVVPRPRGDKNIYIYLDDGLIVVPDWEGKKLIIEVVPQHRVVPIFRYVS